MQRQRNTPVSHAFPKWCVAVRFTHPAIKSTHRKGKVDATNLVAGSNEDTLCTSNIKTYGELVPWTLCEIKGLRRD